MELCSQVYFGSLWVRSWALRATFGERLARSWLALGLVLGASWGVLGCSWAVLGRLGRLLGASPDVLGASWGVLGASWGVLRTLCGKNFEKSSISPPKIEPRTLENQAPTAARAWFERFSDFRNEPSIWTDLGANLPAFWLHFPSPGASWGPLGAVLARLEGVLGRLGGILGASWRDFEKTPQKITATRRQAPLRKTWLGNGTGSALN